MAERDAPHSVPGCRNRSCRRVERPTYKSAKYTGKSPYFFHVAIFRINICCLFKRHSVHLLMHQSNLISALACSTRLRVHRSDASLTLCFASLNRENNVKSGMPVHRFNKPSVETFPDSHTRLTNFVLTLLQGSSNSLIINYMIVWSPLHSIN